MPEPTELAIAALLRTTAPREIPSALVDRARAIPSTMRVHPRWWPAAWSRRSAAAIPAALTALTLGAFMLFALDTTPPAPGGPGGSTLPPKQSMRPTEGTGPAITCGGLPDGYKGVFIPFLTCEAAVDATLSALPKGHPDVTRLAFGFGDYCKPASPCPTSVELLKGYVVVTYATGQRVLAALRDESGQSGVEVLRIEPLP